MITAHLQQSYAQDSPLSQLEITGIRIYHYSGASDYHYGEEPAATVQAGSPIAINGLIRNQNYAAEHFDYITEVFDSEGSAIYLSVRQGVAVPLGGQLGIDSEAAPVILDSQGSYMIKVFAWEQLDDGPEPLSYAVRVTISVTKRTRSITFKLSICQSIPTSTKPMGNKLSGRGAGEKKTALRQTLLIN
jgi:hypothetical protein